MTHNTLRPEITAIVDSIDAIRARLVENAPEGERLRRLTDGSFDAIAATGAFSVSAPVEFGGLAATTEESHAVARAIGRGDGAAAWIFGILDSGAWILSLMQRQAQADVWGAGAPAPALISVVLAPTSDAVATDGGYRVTGRWGYGTGSQHAGWSLLGIPLKDADGAVVDAGLALIPTAELTTEDNWYVAGMRASGSITQIADDLFVPAHRVLPLGAAVAGQYPGQRDDTSYATAFVPSLFMKLVGPHLGMGRAALDFVRAKADSKSVPYTGYTRQSDSVAFQLALAKASVELRAAESLAATVGAQLYAVAERGHYPDYAERIEMRAQAGWIVQTITAAVDALVTAHGSAGFAEFSPLQRIWRDQATASRHGHTLGDSGYEAFGKILLGREDEATHVLPVV